jgi:hypothetical protein
VTVQMFCAGQLVGATWPLKVATIWPLVLKKLAPDTITLSPAEPLAGLNEEITGGPAGATATVVDVEVVGVEVVGVVVGAAPARGRVDGERAGTVVVRTEVAAVEDVGAELLVNETINAMAAAPTRTATTATLPINQRSGRAACLAAPDGAGGGVRSGGIGGRLFSRGGSVLTRLVAARPPSGGGEALTRFVAGWAPSDGGEGRGGAPADSRARRTALSMAPRAR